MRSIIRAVINRGGDWTYDEKMTTVHSAIIAVVIFVGVIFIITLYLYVMSLFYLFNQRP
jgi:hypothetical protein